MTMAQMNCCFLCLYEKVAPSSSSPGSSGTKTGTGSSSQNQLLTPEECIFVLFGRVLNFPLPARPQAKGKGEGEDNGKSKLNLCVMCVNQISGLEGLVQRLAKMQQVIRQRKRELEAKLIYNNAAATKATAANDINSTWAGKLRRQVKDHIHLKRKSAAAKNGKKFGSGVGAGDYSQDNANNVNETLTFAPARAAAEVGHSHSHSDKIKTEAEVEVVLQDDADAVYQNANDDDEDEDNLTTNNGNGDDLGEYFYSSSSLDVQETEVETEEVLTSRSRLDSELSSLEEDQEQEPPEDDDDDNNYDMNSDSDEFSPYPPQEQLEVREQKNMPGLGVLRMSTNHEPRSLHSRPGPSPSRKIFICGTCDETFSNYEALKHHDEIHERRRIFSAAAAVSAAALTTAIPYDEQARKAEFEKSVTKLVLEQMAPNMTITPTVTPTPTPTTSTAVTMVTNGNSCNRNWPKPMPKTQTVTTIGAGIPMGPKANVCASIKAYVARRSQFRQTQSWGQAAAAAADSRTRAFGHQSHQSAAMARGTNAKFKVNVVPVASGSGSGSQPRPGREPRPERKPGSGRDPNPDPLGHAQPSCSSSQDARNVNQEQDPKRPNFPQKSSASGPVGPKLRTKTGAVKRHRPTHSSCPLCGKVIKYSWHLKDHLLLHEGVKNYHCHLCPSKFFKQSGLNCHVKNVHFRDRGRGGDQ